MKKLISVLIAAAVFVSCIGVSGTFASAEEPAVTVTVNGSESEFTDLWLNMVDNGDYYGLQPDACFLSLWYTDCNNAVADWEIGGITEGTDYVISVKTKRHIELAVDGSVQSFSVNAVTEAISMPNKFDIYENACETVSPDFSVEYYGKISGYKVSEQLEVDEAVVANNVMYAVKYTGKLAVKEWNIGSGITEGSDYLVYYSDKSILYIFVSDSYTGLITVDTTVACEHEWKDGELVTEPTCINSGEMMYICTICGDTKTETVPPTGEHKWDGGKVAVAPTCGAAGTFVYTCLNCGDTKTQSIDSSGEHSYGERINEVEPTCVKAGSYQRVCAVCGDMKTYTVSPTGAHIEVTDAAVLPTFTAQGKTKGSHCSVCGKVIVAQKPVAKLGAPALSKLAKGKKSFNATWKAVSGVDGYEIQYSLKKNMKNAKIKTVKGASTAKATVKKLKKNKKYYVRIRAYKTIKGKKHYSKWSAKKTVII